MDVNDATVLEAVGIVLPAVNAALNSPFVYFATSINRGTKQVSAWCCGTVCGTHEPVTFYLCLSLSLCIYLFASSFNIPPSHAPLSSVSK